MTGHEMIATTITAVTSPAKASRAKSSSGWRSSARRERGKHGYIIEGSIGPDGVATVKEEFTFLEDGSPRSVELTAVRTCPSCGRAIGTDTHVMGTASCCSAIACAGCYTTCTRCGRSLCRRHAALCPDAVYTMAPCG